MIWKKIFKKNTKKKNIIIDYSLSNIKKGFFVDYDFKSWEVTAHNRYVWQGDDITYEWQLVTFDDTIYLEMESDDEEIWSISRKISFQSLATEIKKHIIEYEDPPDIIKYKEEEFYISESSGGLFFKNEDAKGKELIRWDYADESGKKFISIEQWGENDFTAFLGSMTEEYKFSNILGGQ